jgi:biotin synthase-like enzyme
MIDFVFLNINELEEEQPALMPTTELDYLDQKNWETFIHKMPQKYLELMICIQMGMHPPEIIKTLQYPNIGRYYANKAGMKEFYKKNKLQHFEL